MAGMKSVLTPDDSSAVFVPGPTAATRGEPETQGMPGRIARSLFMKNSTLFALAKMSQ
jgi:hypothetical protein